MLKADDILMPHTSEVIESHQQKCMADFELCFPGVLNKLTDWMKLSEDFKVVYRDCTGNGLPMRLLLEVGNCADISNWMEINDELYSKIVGIATLLWKRRHLILAEVELCDG